ncbi:hypothetical protein Taro_034055 [Colocasia esculenta]|uniref:Uncharacterized protein n=1 Tax=Colocasia esculenta TaxID=4460 RepID=A0A843WEB7_COLES|nr:hypothetical protein [Colocasia esculenta]
MDEGRDLDGVALIDVASEDDLLLCSAAGGREPPGFVLWCGFAFVRKAFVPLWRLVPDPGFVGGGFLSKILGQWQQSSIFFEVASTTDMSPVEQSCNMRSDQIIWGPKMRTNIKDEKLREYLGLYKSCGSPVEKPSKSCLQVEQVPVLTVSPEIKQNSSCKYNLRKSLAWDSAFFTNEGVLDPEELAIVNSTFKKVQINVLPGIQEDARKSGESCTTLDSDSWAAENNEIDLFENIRASIQNLQAKCGKSSSSSDRSKREKLDLKAIGSKVDSISVSTSKDEQISSQAKVKPPFIPKKQGFSGQRVVEKTTRSAGHQRVIQAAAGSREEKPSTRPSRTASGLQIAPSKGASVSRSVHIRSKNEGNSLPVTASKRHITGDQGKVAAKSSPSVKITGSAKLQPTAACSSNSGSGVASYVRIGKAPPESIRKKVSSTNFDQFSSKSANTYPVRASKDISRARNANITLKFSSSISPSSSIESFASESSSSSTSTARIPANSTGALDYGSSPCLGFTAYIAPQDNSAAKSLKPSGLRLPSPKIGYFDAEKSVPSTNKGPQRSHQVGMVRNMSKLNNNNVPVPQEKSGKNALAMPTKSNPHCLELTNPPATGSPTSPLLQVKSCSDMLDNVGESQNHSQKCPTNQETSCNSKNINLKANNVGLETPECRQLSTLSTEDRCQDQFQPATKRATTAGELVIPGEGPEVKEIAGKALEGFSPHIQDSFTEDKWQTISNHEDKENILPSEAKMSATNHT